MSCSISKSDQVLKNVAGELRCHGLKMTRSNADQPSARTLIAANAARCRVIALTISPRTTGHRRASLMTNGVANAHGNQETKTIKKGRSHALPASNACIVRRVWLALNDAPAHQMTAIQVLLVEGAAARASVMIKTLHQSAAKKVGCNEWRFCCNKRSPLAPAVANIMRLARLSGVLPPAQDEGTTNVQSEHNQ
jgi:hypothetical protein